MTKALIETLFNAQNRKSIEDADQRRLVKIPTGSQSTTDFDISAEDKNWLFYSGYKAANEFLQRWDVEKYKLESNRISTPRA